MRVLLDTNVILDAMLQRLPWHKEADAILEAAARGSVVCAATPLSLATCFYVGRKIIGSAKARSAVRSFVTGLLILPMDRQSLIDADALSGVDFEDNLQIACAATASLDAIVTRNRGDFSHSSIPVCDPPELLHWLASGSRP